MFSKQESKVLRILGRKKLTITELADEYFKDEEKVIDPNNTICGVITRINRKCDFNNLDWFVSGEGLGRHGRTVWKEKL